MITLYDCATVPSPRRAELTAAEYILVPMWVDKAFDESKRLTAFVIERGANVASETAA